MVRQPRESVGEADLLELPAGKLDAEGESPLECARRELREEVGMRGGPVARAEALLHQPRFTERGGPSSSRRPDLETVEPDPDEGERIEVVAIRSPSSTR